MFLNSNKKENTSFLCVGFGVLFFVNFFLSLSFMQKELGESMRIFEVLELAGSEK